MESKSDTINASSSNTEETNKEGTNNERRASTDDPDKIDNVKDLNSVLTPFEDPNGQETGNIEVDRGKDSQSGEEKRGVDQSGDSLTQNTHTEKQDLGSTKQIHSSGFQQTKQAQIASGDPLQDEDEDEKPKHISSDSQPKKTIHSKPELEKHAAEGNAGKLQVKEEKPEQISSGSHLKKTIHFEPKLEKYAAEGNAGKLQVKEEKPEQISSGSHLKKTIHFEPKLEKYAAEGNAGKLQVKEGSLQQSPFTGLPQQSKPAISTEGDNNKLLWIGFFAVFFAVICGLYLPFSDTTLPVPNKLNVVDVFNQEMEKLKTSFPSQRSELWKRSLIHLRRHLKTEHPTEPVSLILTSGRGAEKTLGCLAQCLAQAFSTSRNSSVLSINGKGKTTLDSDQVKLDIDSELTKAFEGEKFAAVIHRFEELPPGSTLIFYRYCDHENAAYKNVFLAFTIMLGAEVEELSSVNLGRVEEMVQEHVTQKFVSSDKSAMFNQMDVDKLSGLWSRISHLILPVVAETRIEQQGCGYCNKSI